MTAAPSGRAVVMLLENNAYPGDVRVRREAESLTAGGHRVTVVAPRGPGQPWRETVRGVRVWRFPLREFPATTPGFVAEYAVANLFLHLLGLVALARGAGVVHLHNPPDTLFPIALVARLLGRRVVYDQHDLAPELFRVKFGAGSPLVRAVSFFERMTYRAASVVVVPNESHREIALGRGGVSPARVAVVRNGPPAATIVAAPEGASANGAGGRLDEPHLLFLGSMEAQDGVDDLPDVLRELEARHGLRARLTLVGDGSRREPVAEAFAAAGLSGRVAFTGKVPLADVPGWLARADVCLDPAEPNELNHRSTMIKVAEYLAAGRPVVAHRLLETERTAGDAAAFSASFDAAGLADAVAAVCADGTRRAAMVAAGLERVRDLTWERSEEELLRVYAAL